MNAIKEIGIKKTIRFILAGFFLPILRVSYVPQLRSTILKILGARIGQEAIVHNISLFNVYHKGFRMLSVGNNCFIGDEVMLDLASEIRLEDHATLSNRVSVLTHTNVGYHDHPLQKHLPKMEKPVVFGRGCFVGAGAIILPGITVGEGAIVGAGAVVTKSVRPWTVVAGVPARKIRVLPKP